ncbi:hypothetical protein RSOLAG1IB_07880 [Rhizoctonia solani AG-1 IB]|uniref:C3H1-type domain-containing protein n=1 Tax=Thanatephorus cucumeris (strain AG1-IB / isolate 7/3/14) TaxID=1108050 RepID=A0A0B7FET6_THACB|nr:hypothetical protein RSOLAG1IB_07880 [Rhizoctonia solani AG-1 IB]
MQPSTSACRYFSSASGCIKGGHCRFQHIRSSAWANHERSDEPTNNRGSPPRDDSSADANSVKTHPRDTRFYQLDGSGVFLVDGVLFKVQATAIFGPRSTVKSNRGSTPLYIEDIFPRLSGSSDTNPTELSGITKEQFRNYLLPITSLPYDEEYSKLLVDYLTPENHNQDLCVKYLDIAAVSQRLGMTKLEEWATNALCAIFTQSAGSFRRIAYEWEWATLLRLREWSRETFLDLPVQAFIQYLVLCITQDIRNSQGGGSLFRSADLVQIYQGFKNSESNEALFGCAFLNILSLGHRSQVWSDLTRDDRAIFYAAQAQLIDLPCELTPGTLAWVASPKPALLQQLCNGCQKIVSDVWAKTFEECFEGIGSDRPLKDVRLLAEMPIYRPELWKRMSRKAFTDCSQAAANPSRFQLPSTAPVMLRPATTTCPFGPLLNDVDQHIKDIYVQIAVRYQAISR